MVMVTTREVGHEVGHSQAEDEDVDGPEERRLPQHHGDGQAVVEDRQQPGGRWWEPGSAGPAGMEGGGLALSMVPKPGLDLVRQRVDLQTAQLRTR